MRLSLRDQVWASTSAMRAVGPVSGLSAEAVRAALVTMHASDPTQRLLRGLDEHARRWYTLNRDEFAQRLDRLVVAVDPSQPSSVHSVTQPLMQSPAPDQPVTLAVHEDYLCVRISHAMGDGRTVGRLFLNLLDHVTHGVPRSPEASPRRTRAALLQAMARHFGRHPLALPAALRVNHPPRSPIEATQPWKPQLSYSSARSSSDGLRAVRAWRDAHYPQVSIASVMFAAATAAFRRHNLHPQPGFVLLIDARRYLPYGATVEGNFSWGQYVVPADLEDPRAIDATIRAELASGRSLMMLGLRDAKLALRSLGPRQRTQPQQPTLLPQGLGPALSLSYLGRLERYSELPWLGDSEAHRLVIVPTPAGATGVTLSIAEMSGALHVNAGFHATSFRQQDLDAAVELLASRPTDLLSVGSTQLA